MCGDDSIDSRMIKMILDESFSSSAIPGSKRIPIIDATPVSCWPDGPYEVCSNCVEGVVLSYYKTGLEVNYEVRRPRKTMKIEICPPKIMKIALGPVIKLSSNLCKIISLFFRSA